MKTLFFFVLFALNACADSLNSMSGADRVINKYIHFEETSNYRKVYDLFSDGFRKRLGEDFSVIDSSKYEKLRESSEAKWHNFADIKMKAHYGKLLVTLSAVVEENGESEHASVLIELVVDKGEWRIDSINYR